MASTFDVDQIRDYRACWDPAEVVQVLDALDRLVERNAMQHRQAERMNYLTPVLIAQNRKLRLQDGSRAILHVMARNLSRSGMGLLSPLLFEPEPPCREAANLRGINVFRDGAVLEVGLRKACGSTLWLYSTVIRARTVQHDFLDVGLRFNARINALDELQLQ